MKALFTLYGSPISTYYNKVKIALVELGCPFSEVAVMPGEGNWPGCGSPSGKIPWLQHGTHGVYESQAIVEYLDELRAPGLASLFGDHALQRALCRELIQYIELYLDAPMQPVYQAVFWARPMAADLLPNTLDKLAAGLRIIERRAVLSPWLAGERFTHADAAAWVHLSTMCWALAIAGHKTYLQEQAPALTDYLARLADRPSIVQTEADRRAESARIKAARSQSAASKQAAGGV